MQKLLGELDVSSSTWSGDWTQESPIRHLDSSLDKKEEDEASLFHIFNTLPSPDPNPDVVLDDYSRGTMQDLLDSNIDGLITTMYHYQRRSAATMLQREVQPDLRIDPRLTPVVDQNGVAWHCDFVAATCLREPARLESSTGGILAETMGLGKTLICLALILATKNTLSQIPVEHSVGIAPVRSRVGTL